jgi:hypothetical protein
MDVVPKCRWIINEPENMYRQGQCKVNREGHGQGCKRVEHGGVDQSKCGVPHVDGQLGEELDKQEQQVGHREKKENLVEYTFEVDILNRKRQSMMAKLPHTQKNIWIIPVIFERSRRSRKESFRLGHPGTMGIRSSDAFFIIISSMFGMSSLALFISISLPCSPTTVHV